MRPSLSIVSVAAAAALALATAPAGAQIQVGDRPEFTFRDGLYGVPGATSLADFRGKPVLVDFWGTQ